MIAITNQETYSLSNLLKERGITDVRVIDIIIRSKHKKLLLYSSRRNIHTMISNKNYRSIIKDVNQPNTFYFITTKGDFEVRFDEGDDVIGFTTNAAAFLCMEKLRLHDEDLPKPKLIFSPQLANYLLRLGFKLIHLKPRNSKTNEVVYVFLAEQGFFDAVENFKKGITN